MKEAVGERRKAKYLVLFGPPGAGKGTQAKKVAKALDLPSISTGDIFRTNLKNKTELGRKAEAYLSRGELVPDDVTIGMVRDTLAQPEYAGGVILDGFPRTLEQAEALSVMVNDLNGELQVVFVQVPDEVLVERITGRIMCRKCGRVYHKTFNPPPPPPIPCDQGGECDLYQREDDEKEIISNRIRVYHEQTAPLITYFQAQGVLLCVDGSQAIDTVTERILAGVK